MLLMPDALLREIISSYRESAIDLPICSTSIPMRIKIAAGGVELQFYPIVCGMRCPSPRAPDSYVLF